MKLAHRSVIQQTSHSVPLVKQEVSAFSCLLLMDPCRFHILNLVSKTGMKPFWTSPFCSASLKSPFRRKQHRLLNKWLENAYTSCLALSDVWRFCVLPFSPSARKSHHRHQFCIVYNNLWHEREDNSYKIGGLEVAISQSMCAWPQWW